MAHVHALHLAAEVLAAVDQLARHDAVGQDLRVVIDVLQEQVQRGDALGQAALEHVPLGGGDDPGNQVVGEDPLGALAAAVDGEGDALVQEGEIGGRLALVHLAGADGLQAVVERLRTARAAGRARRTSRRRRRRARRC